MTILIPLSKRSKKYTGMYSAIVDECDADLMAYGWTADIKKATCYAHRKITVQGGSVTNQMHRVIMERVVGRSLSRDEKIDHINGNGLDNRRENLRVCSHSQNLMNRGKNSVNSTGYKGVYRASKNKWRAIITCDYKEYYLGTFNTPEEAYRAYCEAGKRLHGEFFNDGTE